MTSFKSAEREPVRAELVYEGQPAAGGVSRRWLMLLTALLLLNVVATTSISWGPPLVQSIRQSVDARRAAAANARAAAAKAAADAAALQQFHAARKTAAAYDLPAGQVIYSDDPVESRTLAASRPDYSCVTRDNAPALGMPEPPVLWDGTPQLRGLITRAFGGSSHVLFLHERKTPSGEPILVCSRIDVQEVVQTREGVAVMRARKLQTYLCEPFPMQIHSGTFWSHELFYHEPPERWYRYEPAAASGATSAGAPVGARLPNVRQGDIMRFLAGRADPRDATHFTIDYTLNGKAGVIDGWVTGDRRVRVVPREGSVFTTQFDLRGGAQRWDPYAAPREK
jgi:hypothetical protein